MYIYVLTVFSIKLSTHDSYIKTEIDHDHLRLELHVNCAEVKCIFTLTLILDAVFRSTEVVKAN